MKLWECYKKILALLMAVCMAGAGVYTTISVQGAEYDDDYQDDEEYQTDDEGMASLFFVDEEGSETDELYIKLGASEYLFLESDPEDAWSSYDDSIIWSSSKPSVATVDQDGEIKAKKLGTTTITAKWDEDPSVYAECKVTVADLKLKKTSFTLNVGATEKIKVKSVYPKGDDISFESSNEKVARVDDNGKIKAVKAGKAIITAESESGIAVKCKVTVNASSTKKLKLQKRLTAATGTKVALWVKREPKKATDKLIWKSSNTKVAAVNKKGVLTAKKSGKAVITVKSANGKTASCNVRILDLKLKKASASIKPGMSTKIKIVGSYAKKDKVLSYKSSNRKVASVDKNGNVKGMKAGKAQITVKMKSGAAMVFNVTVKKK